MTLVSQAEYARHRGVSRKTVTVWKKEGRLAMEGGKVDVEASDAHLAERNGRGNRNDDTAPAQAPETAAEQPANDVRISDGLAALMGRLDLMSRHQAEQVKENYLALLRQLEYDQKAGRVVAVEDVAQTLTSECALVRNRLLAIPTELAPRIAAATGGHAAEIREMLLEGVTEALEKLSCDGGTPGGDGQRPVS